MLVLPITSDPARSFTTEFEDGKYTITTRYNERGGFWTIDLLRDVDQVQLLSGVPLLLGQDLLAPYALGIGGLIATDVGQTETDAGPEDLGERVILMYVTRAELSLMDSAGIPGLSVHAGDPGTPEFEGGTGGTVSEVNALVDLSEKADITGDEHVVMEFDVDLDAIASPTVRLAAAFLGFTEAGTNTIRAYLGGTEFAVDGVLMGSTPVIWGPYIGYSLTGTAPNVGGQSRLKISMQSSGSDIEAKIKQFSGRLR